MMKNSIFFLLFLVVVSTSWAQGVTTSAINGKITDASGEPLAGANVVAVHNPSGTKYGAITDFDGFFRIVNMRVGGPYTITMTYVGFEDYTKTDIYLALGESQELDLVMTESSSQLEEVLVKATRNDVFDSGRTGTETNISTREINALPSVTRGIGDFVRKTPQALVSESGSISLAGQNNRYNSIYLDGTVNNDVFGLASSGTNGGQTGVNPLSIDAIESFQVNLSPFDVRQSGFSGGSINAITRSGTNETQGSLYYYFRNEKLAGKTPTAISEDNREKLDEFSAKLYGARVGGAILKDKLFYFVNYERQDEETPRPFNFGEQYNGNSSLEQINELRQGLINTYGYDPGDFGNTISSLQSDKLSVRLDYNIDQNNTIIAKNNYVKAEQDSPSGSGARNINFASNGVIFPSTTNTTSLEWNTGNGSNLANNVIVGYTTVKDDRNPIGNPFPEVTLFDGDGRIQFGSEAFSTANLLEQKVFTISENFSIFSGPHNITLGASYENTDVLNVFVGQNFGDYTFNSLADFNTYLDDIDDNEVGARFYNYNYSLIGGRGDNSLGAADFTYSQLGFYVQDEYDLSDDIKVTAGLRVDVPYFSDQLANEDFNSRTIPLLESFGKDLQNAEVGKSIKSKEHISPRIGLNWDVAGKKSTQIRGGLGIFTSRIPLVWPGGTYSNNGVSQGAASQRSFTNPVLFNPDVNNQAQDAAVGSGAVGGNVDIFSPDFKLPQTLKYNLAIDQKLPFFGLIASGDFLYNDVITNVFYENLNVKPAVGTLNGVDNRPYYNFNDPIDPTYDRIILGSNTSLGYSYNATFTLSKPFSRGFSAQVAYTYGDGQYVFEGTSSQNSSQWRNLNTVNGKNANPVATNSDFATGSRISANALYEYKWNDNIKTTISAFYTGAEGSRYSFVYNNRANLLNDDSRDNALLYIPRNASEINLVPLNIGTRDNPIFISPEDQWTALNTFIEGDDYLKGRRGKYAESNGDRGPWSHIVDLKVLQDFSLNLGNDKHTFQASLDIFNFTNLVNKDWGRRKFIPSNVGLITTTSGGPDPTFNFDPDFVQDGIVEVDDSGTQSSRWQMQVGLRYLFN